MSLCTSQFCGAILSTVGIFVPALGGQIKINSDHQCEYACNQPRPACEVTWRSNVAAVFLGTASQVNKEDVPILLDGEKAFTEKLTVQFKVEESFRGVPSDTLSVVSGGDLCGYPFSKGKRYLVFADSHPDDPRLHVDICSETKGASEAGDDLAYLRRLRSFSKGGYVYGSIFQFITPEKPEFKTIRVMKAVANQRVHVQGSHTYEATSDSHGNFRVDGVTPGAYTVSVIAGASVYPGQSQTITVENKGCAMVDFELDPFTDKRVLQK